jgi:hypothetical protein
VYVPNCAPIQFKSNVPYGNITEPGVQREFSQLGGEYQAWGKIMKKINEKYDDYNTIHQRITDDKQEKTLIAAEYGVKNGVNVANFAPYTNLSVLRNHDEVADAIQHLNTAPHKYRVV